MSPRNFFYFPVNIKYFKYYFTAIKGEKKTRDLLRLRQEIVEFIHSVKRGAYAYRTPTFSRSFIYFYLICLHKSWS